LRAGVVFRTAPRVCSSTYYQRGSERRRWE
jgi:hypothetical protein